MIIDRHVIKKLIPCKDRFDNYINYYKNNSFTLAQFLGLKNISQADKLWVCFRLMPEEHIALAAADIAKSVLYVYEEKYPNDNRLRLAIEAIRNSDYAAADHVAAINAFKDPYAASAASAVVYAIRAATSTFPHNEAEITAVYAVTAVTSSKEKQEKLIRKIVLKYMK